MIPTGRLVAALMLPVVLGFVAVATPAAVVPMVALDLVVLLVAAIDLALATGAVRVTRNVPAVHSVGEPFDVELHVANTGHRALSVRVTDDAPGQTDGLPADLRLARGTLGVVRYAVSVPTRGAHPFGPVTVRWRSPLGLWERQRSLPVAGDVKIYPNFRQLRTWGLLARQDERRVPVRARRRPGGETEFQRLRPYVAGDAFRHVDWRATARRRQLITREYGQETNQNVILLLDAGRMMTGSTAGLTFFDHALDAALVMGQVALRHGDRVGLLAFDHRVRVWLPPKGGSRTGARLIRGTYDVFPSMHEADYGLAMSHLAQRVRRRSLVVLLTTVVDDVNADLADILVQHVGRRHLPVCVWLRDPEVEALLEPHADPYVAGAAAELSLWRERALNKLRQRGALVVDADPNGVTPALLSTYLEIKARRLL